MEKTQNNDVALTGEFPIIALGYGLIEVAEGHQDNVPALIFGRNGSGQIGDPTQPERAHLPGETLAVVTFANVASLDVVLERLSTIRAKMGAAPVAAAAPAADDAKRLDQIEKARRVLGQIANRDSGYFYNDGYPRSVTIKKEVENVLKVLNTLAAAAPSDHTDDLAVDRFAAAMKAKMAASRAKGRNGWDNPDLCPVERLQGMLLDHLAKGDPVDIGNFAMMLFNRNAPVAAAAPGAVPDEDINERMRRANKYR